MRPLSLCLVFAATALIAAPTALADGGPFQVGQGGSGVAMHAFPGRHWVALPDFSGGTILELVEHGQVTSFFRLAGGWGLPSIGSASPVGAGLSGDDHTLVLSSTTSYSSPSKFLVVDPGGQRTLRAITLRGVFSFDALSPDGSKLYFIEYVSTRTLTHYVVREYDMRTNRLLPGRIADRSEHEESMAGYPLTRTTSANGRWVYTLYSKQVGPGGESFVHALDTERGVAHCIDLPANPRIGGIVLSLRDGGRTLAARWRNGHPWRNIAVGSWRVSRPTPAASSSHAGSPPWGWIGAGIGGGLAVLAAAALLLRRRRGQKVEQRIGEELGLA